MNEFRWFAYATLTVLLGLPSSGSAQIKNGDLVTIEYNMTDDTGKQLDSSHGQESLSYEHGKGSLIPGLEKQLTGMRPGERKVIRVTPNEAHGSRRLQNIREVALDQLPGKELKAGDRFVYVGPEGQRSPVTVLQVKEKTVILDFNHPLAGKTLIFDIKIVDVKKKNHETTEERPRDHTTAQP